MANRKGELVSVHESEADLAARLSPLARAQYWWFRRTEGMGHSRWTRDIRFVLVASLGAIVMIVAAALVFGGSGLLSPPDPTLKPDGTKLPAPGTNE